MKRQIVWGIAVAATMTIANTRALADKEDPKVERLRAEHEKAFKPWLEKRNNFFDEAWAAIQEAEEKARPSFEEGKALKEKSMAKAEKKLLEARKLLLTHPKAGFIPLQVGLAYEIAAELGELYQDPKRAPDFRREAMILRNGRRWESEDDERALYLFNMAEIESYAAHIDKEQQDKPRPLKDRRKTKRILNYLGIKRDHGVYNPAFDAGRELYKKWSETSKRIGRAHDYELYKELGGEGGHVFHDSRAEADSYSAKSGPIVVVGAKVTKVRGRKATFDFRHATEEGVNCKTTSRVRRVNIFGQRQYQRKCDTRKAKGGHKLVVKLPKGLKLKKKDHLSFVVPVKRTKGDKGGTIFGGLARVLYAARGDKVMWIYDTKSKRRTDFDFCTRRVVPSVGAGDPLAVGKNC